MTEVSHDIATKQEHMREADEIDIKRMCKMFEITEETVSDLKMVRELLEEHIDGILDQFYNRILRDPVMGAVFDENTDPRRARTLQRAHWMEWVFAGKFNGRYLARCKRIGRAHKTHGILPSYYLFGYHFMSHAINRKIAALIDDKTTACRLMSAVETALFLDIDLVISVYCTEMTADWRHASLYDELTGIMNRRGIAEALTRTLPATRDFDKVISIALLDIDYFKSVNDTYGHDGGDKALASVADLISNTLRDDDFVGRWGGEEFIVVMPDTDLAKAEKTAERLRLALEEMEIPLDGPPLKLTASFGVSEVRDTEDTIDEAAQRADEALYEAKRKGRNRVVARRADTSTKQSA